MGVLKIILIPVMLITIIGGSYFAIVDGIKDSITVKIGKLQEILNDSNIIKEEFRKVSNWIEDKLNIGSYKLPNGPQTLFFEIDNTKFEEIKTQIDDIINVEEGGYDDIIIKKMLLTYYSSICTRDTQILIAVTEEEYNQFDNSAGNFEKVSGDKIGGKQKDLYLSTYGIIELYRNGLVNTDNKLIYLPKEDLEKVKTDAVSKKMDNAVEALSRCYTIDEIGKIQMYEVSTNVEDKNQEYNNNQEKEKENLKETRTEKLVTLDYGQYASYYTIPVEFLSNLLNITGSTDFIDKFSTLQYDSYIRLGVYQTSLKKITTTTSEYDLKTTIKGTKPLPNTAGSANLNELKAKFPHGYYWGGEKGTGYQEYDVDEVRTNCRCTDYTGRNCVSPQFDGGRQCWGFSHKLAYDYYGSFASGWNKKYSKSELKAGDILRIDNKHSVWVIGREGDIITVAECNYSGYCQIGWGRKINLDDISITFIESAPYAIESENDPHNTTKTVDATANNIESKSTSSTVGKQDVEYSEEKTATTTKTLTETSNYYEIEIVDIDTWYVKITQNNKRETEKTYKAWNNNKELVDVEKDAELLKIASETGSTITSIPSIENMEDGMYKKIIEKLISKAPETEKCTWERAEIEKKDEIQTKKMEIIATTLTKGVPQVKDNTDKFLALLKTTSGVYNREDVKKGKYDPNGKVISYEDIYKGKAYVGNLLESGADILFELLEESLDNDNKEIGSNTKNLVDVMKYIMWRYNGKNYGVTNFNMIDVIHSNLVTVGADIVVKVTEQNEMVLDKDKILETIDMMNYSAKAKENMKGAIEGFMKIQNDYKVNAVFAIAVTMTESGGGTAWDAIDSSTYNWMSVKSSSGWAKYSSFSDATEKFGNLIANGDYYFKVGKITVKQIAPTYCNEKWGETVLGFMTEFYKKAGVSVNLFSGGDFIEIAKKCHDYLRENQYFYSYGDNKSAKKYVTDGPASKHGGIVADYVPKPNEVDGCKIVDCSSYVTWVLYEYGYTELKGWQKSSTWFYNQQYPSSYGWQKINSSQAQPGDILVNSGHVEIYAGNNQSYSCGSTQTIRAIISNCNPSSFSFAIRIPSK